MNIKTAILIACAIVLVGSGAAFGDWISDRNNTDRYDALVSTFKTQVHLTDSQTVILAADRAKVRELTGLVDAGKQLNGTVIAGFRAHIQQDSVTNRSIKLVATKHDTVTVAHTDTVPLIIRTSFGFGDSTKAGRLAGTVWLPDSLSYSFVPNPVTPSVGFVNVGTHYVAVVSCDNCGDVRIDVPFFDQGKIKEILVPRLSPWIGAQWNVATSRWTTNAATDLRLFSKLEGQAELSRTWALGETTKLQFGFFWRF